MNIGDLVEYNEFRGKLEAHRGIIVAGPERANTTIDPPIQWEVVWYDTPTRGWWNEEFLELVSELPSR